MRAATRPQLIFGGFGLLGCRIPRARCAEPGADARDRHRQIPDGARPIRADLGETGGFEALGFSEHRLRNDM